MTKITSTLTLKRAAILAVSLTLLALTACNTVKGVGKDISGAAEATERAIDKATD
ncbi:MAG: hypothetical protein IPK69_05510 [Phycisphaerales bacterium]|nr:MAG: hypothetical protein IPK69_05510 [Phycisphaerales bacterium]